MIILDILTDYWLQTTLTLVKFDNICQYLESLGDYDYLIIINTHLNGCTRITEVTDPWD